jgi:hypothetical protein
MDAPHAFFGACGLLIQAAEAHDKPGFAGYFIHPPAWLPKPHPPEPDIFEA